MNRFIIRDQDKRQKIREMDVISLSKICISLSEGTS